VNGACPDPVGVLPSLLSCLLVADRRSLVARLLISDLPAPKFSFLP